MPHLLGLSLALSAALTGTPVQVAPVAPTQTMPQAQTVKEYVSTYFADAPVMAAIAYCESRNRQYDTDGSIFRGIVNSKDVGVMQINEYYHSDTAAKLGLDLFTLQGNTAYARYLYEKEGVQPWSSSQPCWGKTAAAKAALALAK
ncbi:MAG: hypothetical protein JWO43_412 [Candidatus Adlerbacteria bacterium]|nr:hypothetical protein [Candidatus Adlerbacteria bacterium]